MPTLLELFCYARNSYCAEHGVYPRYFMASQPTVDRLMSEFEPGLTPRHVKVMLIPIATHPNMAFGQVVTFAPDMEARLKPVLDALL